MLSEETFQAFLAFSEHFYVVESVRFIRSVMLWKQGFADMRAHFFLGYIRKPPRKTDPSSTRQGKRPPFDGHAPRRLRAPIYIQTRPSR